MGAAAAKEGRPLSSLQLVWSLEQFLAMVAAYHHQGWQHIVPSPSAKEIRCRSIILCDLGHDLWFVKKLPCLAVGTVVI